MASTASGMLSRRAASSSVITMGIWCLHAGSVGPRRRVDRASQPLDPWHHLGAEQLERAQRLLQREVAEEKVAEEVSEPELVGLAFDLGHHGRGRAGDRHAVPLPFL